MKPRLKKRILFDLLLLSYLLFSYYALGGWWNSAVGSVLIVFFAWLLWGKQFPERTGLKISFSVILMSIVLTLLIIILSSLVIHNIAVKNNINIRAGEWKDYFHEVFYIFNEEVVLGAIILFYLAGSRKINPVLSCILLAAFFSLIHFIFYKWIFDARGTIGLITLTTLFMIGFLRNSLILLTGHIGYSWALHFGWMSVMFGATHSYISSGELLSESFKFNIYLGSYGMLIISIISAMTAFYFILRKKSLAQY